VTMRRWVLVLGAGAVTIAGVAVLYEAYGHRPGGRLAAESASRSSASVDRIAELESRLRGLELREGRGRAEPRPPPRAAGDTLVQQPGGASTEDETAPITAALAKRQAEIDLRMARWQSEARDPDWSHQMEEGIHGTLEQRASKGNRVTFLECRTTMCQFRVSHAGAEQQQQFAQQIVSSLPPHRAATFYAEDTDTDHRSTLVFLSREGHELPKLAANAR
jgi:hypothetical protein